MPKVRQAQLQRLITINTRQIAEIEARLMDSIGEDEMRRVIELAAELQVTKLDLQELLEGEAAEE